MISLSFVILLLAFICLFLAAIKQPSPPPRVDLTALGLALWVLSLLVTGIGVR